MILTAFGDFCKSVYKKTKQFMIRNCLTFHFAAIKITSVKFPNSLTVLQRQEKESYILQKYSIFLSGSSIYRIFPLFFSLVCT